MEADLKQKNDFQDEIRRIMKSYSARSDFLQYTAAPSSIIISTFSVLSVSSLFLLLSGSNQLIKTIAGISILIMLPIVLLALFLQLKIYHAQLHYSSFQYHIENHQFLEVREYSAEELVEVDELLILARKGLWTIKQVEWMQKHLLWRLSSLFVFLVFILMISAISMEIMEQLVVI